MPPFHRKLGADTAMPAPLAIKIAAPFPRNDRRQIPRLQRGYLPQLGRKIGNPRKPHFSVRPALNPCPVNGLGIVPGFRRLIWIEITGRLSGAAGLNGYDDETVRHPAFRIDRFAAADSGRTSNRYRCKDISL